MTDKANHIVWAAEAVAVFQKHCRTGDEHVIADLICDLGQTTPCRVRDGSPRWRCRSNFPCTNRARLVRWPAPRTHTIL